MFNQPSADTFSMSKWNEQAGLQTNTHYTRQFRGCRQAGQRAGAPDESPKCYPCTLFILVKKHEGRIIGILSRIAGL